MATAEHENQDAACIRETESGKIIHTLVGHQRPTNTVAISFDGKLVVTASWDKTLIVWDAQTGKELRTFTGHTGEVYPVAFDPKSHLVLSGDATGTAILWHADTGQLLQKLQGHTKTVQAVAFSKDGNTLATSGGGIRPSSFGIRLRERKWRLSRDMKPRYWISRFLRMA